MQKIFSISAVQFGLWRFMTYPEKDFFVALMKPEPVRHGTPMANQV